MNRLLELPQRPQFARAAPARPSYRLPNSLEWTVLASLLCDLTLSEHIDEALLDPDLAESRALLGIRERLAAAEDDLSFPVLLDSLEGNPWVDTVLAAYRYGQELNLEGEEVQAELQHALVQLDIRRRKKELDDLRTRLVSKEDLIAFNEKNLVYKRLQGAVPSQAAS
jgi:hypothetical protein